MGKQMPIEKSIDHRGEGYTAADAMFEHNTNAAITKRKSITTKQGLPFYSAKELEKKGGEVYSYNFNARIPYEVFNGMSIQNKKDYIEHLIKKYEGLAISDLAKMFGVSPGTLSIKLHDLGIKFDKGGKRFKSDGRIRFEEEMITPYLEPEPEPEEEPVYTETFSIITDVTFECDAESIADMLKRLGMTGRVRVNIKASDKGGVRDDGSNQVV